MPAGEIPTNQFVPADLRERELFRRTILLLDDIDKDVYLPHLQATINAFNPLGENFDTELLLSSMGGPFLSELIIGRRPQVTDQENGQDKYPMRENDPGYMEDLDNFLRRSANVTHILPRLFNLKGTTPGLNLILGLAGITTTEIIGWEVWRGYLNNQDSSVYSAGPVTTDAPNGVYRKAYADFSRAFPSSASGLDDDSRDELACKVYFTVGQSGDGSAGVGSLANLDRDERILQVVRRFMPVCTEAVVEVTSEVTTDSRAHLSVGPDDNGMIIVDTGLLSSRRAVSDEDGGPDETLLSLSDTVSEDIVNINQRPLVYGAGYRYERPDASDPIRYTDGSGAGSGGVSVYDTLEEPVIVDSG